MHTVIRHAIQDDGFTVVVTGKATAKEVATFQYYINYKNRGHTLFLQTEEVYDSEEGAIAAFDEFNTATAAIKRAT